MSPVEDLMAICAVALIEPYNAVNRTVDTPMPLAADSIRYVMTEAYKIATCSDGIPDLIAKLKLERYVAYADCRISVRVLKLVQLAKAIDVDNLICILGVLFAFVIRATSAGADIIHEYSTESTGHQSLPANTTIADLMTTATNLTIYETSSAAN